MTPRATATHQDRLPLHAHHPAQQPLSFGDPVLVSRVMYLLGAGLYLGFPWLYEIGPLQRYDVLVHLMLGLHVGLLVASFSSGFARYVRLCNQALIALIAAHLLLVVWATEAHAVSVTGVFVLLVMVAAVLPYNFGTPARLLPFFAALALGAVLVDLALGGQTAGAHALVLALAVTTLCLGLAVGVRRYRTRARAPAPSDAASLHDTITALPRRSLFRMVVEARLASRQAGGGAMLIVDLDRFRKINEALGQERGDRFLAATAASIQSCVRPDDLLARFGGDEFAILLSLGSADAADRVARRIQSTLAAGLSVDGETIFCSASVGIALHGAGQDAEALIDVAAAALQRAKAGGPGGRALVAPGAPSRSADEARLEQELWAALDRDELVVHYQPVVDAGSRQVVGLEALVRWNHPRLGLIFPGRFIDLAAESGLIVPLERQVLARSLDAIQWLRRQRPALWVAVNVSGRRLLAADFPDEVIQSLLDRSLPGDALRLEVVEGVLGGEDQAAARALERLRVAGVRIEIDDFGTGYSSLARIHELPIDGLKVDRSFIARGAKDDSVLQVIRHLADALDAEVIAEGVETAEHLELVRRLGFDLVQGWFFARAVPLEEVDLILRLSAGEGLRPGLAAEVTTTFSQRAAALG